MGFRCRFICVILLLFLLFALGNPFVVTYASGNDDSCIISNISPSENIDGMLKSFDISQTGEILLFFQDASAYGICTVHVLDSTGEFIVEHSVTTAQSGSVLACFDDNGDVLLHYVRTDETYVIRDNALDRVSVPKDRFKKTEVPPVMQRKNLSHSFQGATYTLYSPGLFDSGYTLMCSTDSGEQLIWTGGAAYIQEEANRELLFVPMVFSIIGMVCIGTAMRNKHWYVFAKVLMLLHACVIVATCMLIQLIGSEKSALSRQGTGSVGAFVGVFVVTAVLALCDGVLLSKLKKPADPIISTEDGLREPD